MKYMVYKAVDLPTHCSSGEEGVRVSSGLVSGIFLCVVFGLIYIRSSIEWGDIMDA